MAQFEAGAADRPRDLHANAGDPARPSPLGKVVPVRAGIGAASTPRFRATERRRLRISARHGLLIVIAAAILDCVWLVPFHPEAATAVLALNIALALLAATGNLAIARRARRRPEIVVLLVLVAVDLATITLGVLHPELGLVARGYLFLLPPIVALAIPWSMKTHVAWLGLHASLVVAYAVLAPNAALSGFTQDGLAGPLLVATAVSQFGHVTNRRARVRGFEQIERIRAMNHDAMRDHARLDRLNRILEQTARTDELTGLKNRLCLKLDMAAVRSRIERRGDRYSLLMLDLDRFKTINDSLGHIAGDGVLRKVATTLASTIRPEDGAYRYGGEEFVVVIRVTGPLEAETAADRIRRTIEDLRLPHPGNLPHRRVTISIGYTTVGPEDLGEDDDAWLARADRALYVAKASGRNRSKAATSATSVRAVVGL